MYTPNVTDPKAPDHFKGAVRVYLGSAGGINPAEYFEAEGEITGSNFGLAVACANDINGMLCTRVCELTTHARR